MIKVRIIHIFVLLLAVMTAGSCYAGEADVVAVEVKKSTNGQFQFDVTIRHNDEGWNHYADNWEILSLDGKILAVRVLHHPHVNEQPFTRSLSGVTIPVGIEKVVVRSHDLIHGYGGKEIEVLLP